MMKRFVFFCTMICFAITAVQSQHRKMIQQDETSILCNKGFDAYKLKQFTLAKTLWEQAAEKETKLPLQFKCMNMLGNVYLNGEGVEQNYNTAMQWFIKAIADGNAWGNNDAAKSIGTMYENGWGVHQSFSKALDYYIKARTMGNRYVTNDIARIREQIKKYGTN